MTYIFQKLEYDPLSILGAGEGWISDAFLDTRVGTRNHKSYIDRYGGFKWNNHLHPNAELKYMLGSVM